MANTNADYTLKDAKNEVFDTIKNTDYNTVADKGVELLWNGYKGGKRGSLISSAKQNMFEFPVFISDNVPFNYASAVTSLLDQVYMSYLQMAISANPTVNINELKNGTPFAKFKTDTNKYLEYTDMSYAHDACAATYVEEGYKLEFEMVSVDDSTAEIITESLNYEPMSEFSHFIQESKKVHGNGNRRTEGSQTKQAMRNAYAGDTSYDGDNDDGQTSNDESGDKTKELQSRIKELEKQLADRDKVLGTFEDKDGNNNVLTKNNDTVNGMIKTLLEVDRLKASQKYMGDTAKQEYDKLKAEADLVQKRLKNYDGVELQMEKLRIQQLENDINQQRNQKKLSSKEIALKTEQIKTQQKQLEKLEADIAQNKKMNPMQFENLKKQNLKLQREIDNMIVLSADDKKFQKKMQQASDAARAGVLGAKIDENAMQRLNTMRPIIQTVTVAVIDNNGNYADMNQNYAIGVKTHSRLIDSSILPEVAEYPLKEMNKLSRKAKWRAGELKFFKDILFNIKGKKQSAIDSNDPKRKWYRRLYNLAHARVIQFQQNISQENFNQMESSQMYQ